MRLLDTVAFASLLATAACRVVPFFPRDHTATNITTLIKVLGTSSVQTVPVLGADSPPPAKRPKPNPPSPDPVTPVEPDPPGGGAQPSEWDKAICRGEKLTRASKLTKDKAEAFALPINTNWDGDLGAERKTWGYFDSPDADCDFEGEYYDIKTAYEALNILDSNSNDCFRTFHYDPDLEVDENGKEIEVKDQTYQVNGKTYHVSIILNFTLFVAKLGISVPRALFMSACLSLTLSTGHWRTQYFLHQHRRGSCLVYRCSLGSKESS